MNDTIVTHGSYFERSRYSLTQYWYGHWNGEETSGYVEVLQIHNPPEGRYGILLNVLLHHNGKTISKFYEFDCVQHALDAAYDLSINDVLNRPIFRSDPPERMQKYTGFLRVEDCGASRPWFYQT